MDGFTFKQRPPRRPAWAAVRYGCRSPLAEALSGQVGHVINFSCRPGCGPQGPRQGFGRQPLYLQPPSLRPWPHLRDGGGGFHLPQVLVSGDHDERVTPSQLRQMPHSRACRPSLVPSSRQPLQRQQPLSMPTPYAGLGPHSFPSPPPGQSELSHSCPLIYCSAFLICEARVTDSAVLSLSLFSLL